MSMTRLEVKFNSHNVTNDLSTHLINWTYTDNLSDSIDDLNITLEDVDAVWISDWFPSEGTVVEASIVKEASNGQDFIMELGLFEIDTIQGMDSTIQIMALATSELTNFRRVQKSTAWEKTALKTIYQNIAERNGMKLYWESSINPVKERVEQIRQSDLAFLDQLSRDEGLCLKLANKQIIVVDEEDYEAQRPTITIHRNPREEDPVRIVGRKSFKVTLNDVYKTCVVRHTDNKNTYTGSFTPKNAPYTTKVLEIRESVKSNAEAERLAKKKLREKNKQGTTMNFDVYSIVPIRAGMTFNLAEFGKLDGKYIASNVAFKGSLISLSLRKCLEGY